MLYDTLSTVYIYTGLQRVDPVDAQPEVIVPRLPIDAPPAGVAPLLLPLLHVEERALRAPAVTQPLHTVAVTDGTAVT